MTDATVLTTEGFARLFVDPGEAYYLLAAFPNGKTVKRRWVRAIDQFPEPVAGANNWGGPSARDPVKWMEPGDDAGNVSLLCARSIFVDYDHETSEQVDAWVKAAGLPEPSITINSGGGQHRYWLFKEPVDISTEQGLAEYEAILKGVTYATNGDKKVCKPAQPIRLPWTLNVKYDPPVMCSITGGNLARYDSKDFAKWAYVQEKRARTQTIIEKPDTNPITTGQALSIAEVIRPVYLDGQRNGLSLALSGLFLKKGVPEDQAERLLIMLSEQFGGSDHSRSARKTYEKAIEDISVWSWVADKEECVQAIKEVAKIINRGEVGDDPVRCKFCLSDEHGKCYATDCDCSCAKKRRR